MQPDRNEKHIGIRIRRTVCRSVIRNRKGNEKKRERKREEKAFHGTGKRPIHRMNHSVKSVFFRVQRYMMIITGPVRKCGGRQTGIKIRV